MKRLSSFLLGVAVGAALIFGALNYHLVRANDGLHLVRKVDARLSGTYVDVRPYTIADWARNPELAAALIDAGKRDLVESSAADAVRNRLDQFLDGAHQPQ